MEKSIKKSALTKIMTGVLVSLLLVTSMFLFAACGGKNTEPPMTLSGKTMVSDYSKTEFNWAEGIDEQVKNEIITGMATQDPTIMVFNANGTVDLGFSENAAPVYYTQEKSTLKVYSDADKTIEYVFTAELKIEFTVGSNFLKVKYIAVGDLTNVPTIDYSLYFYEQV